MRTVIQQDSYGCGTAVIAMLLGITYNRAAELLFPARDLIQQRPISTTAGEIVKVLTQHGLEERGRGRISRKTRLGDLNLDSVLSGYVDCDDRKERLHFMTWDAKQKVIRDPKGHQYPLRVTSYISFERVR